MIFKHFNDEYILDKESLQLILANGSSRTYAPVSVYSDLRLLLNADITCKGGELLHGGVSLLRVSHDGVIDINPNVSIAFIEWADQNKSVSVMSGENVSKPFDEEFLLPDTLDEVIYQIEKSSAAMHYFIISVDSSFDLTSLSDNIKSRLTNDLWLMFVI